MLREGCGGNGGSGWKSERGDRKEVRHNLGLSVFCIQVGGHCTLNLVISLCCELHDGLTIPLSLSLCVFFFVSIFPIG